jgi:hypothetical protein
VLPLEPPSAPSSVSTRTPAAANAGLVEAEDEIEQLATAPASDGLMVRDVWLLRLCPLLARADSDAEVHADFRDGCRNSVRTVGFEGRRKWAEAMP